MPNLHFRFSRTILTILALGAPLLALAGCSVLQPRPVTPISEIVSMSKSGASADQIVARVRSARTTYALKGSDFAELDRLGVPGPVLDELQQRLVNDVDLLTRYAYLGESLGGCDRCYPQPVNLAMLDNGGSGMSDASGLGRAYSYARPQGVPNWVPAYAGRPLAPMITVDQVATMVKDGVGTDEVIAKINDSRLDNIIADNGLSRISTHYSAGLTGSQFATLARQGVPDRVLDALQEKFLGEYVEFARLRYIGWGKGSKPTRSR